MSTTLLHSPSDQEEHAATQPVPSRARPVRFVHTSDWHIGLSRHYLEGEAQARYTAARIDAIRAIGVLAAEQGCEFVVVAGDVFDSNLCADQTVARALDAMADIRCPVYLLPGNHDALNAASLYTQPAFRARQPANVHILTAPGPVPVAPGVELVAAPLFSNAPGRDVLADAVADLAPTDVTRILVGHGIAESFAPTEGNPAALRLGPLEDAIEQGLIDYVALGDRHSRAAVGRTGRIQYSGSPEVTNFLDTAAGEVLVVEVGPGRPPAISGHRIGTWRFVDVNQPVDTADDVAALATTLQELSIKERTVVRTALSGTVSLAVKTQLDQELDRYRDMLAGLFPWERHTDVAVLVDEEQFVELGLGGFADSAVHELQELARTDTARGDAARDALSLLYRLAASSLE